MSSEDSDDEPLAVLAAAKKSVRALVEGNMLLEDKGNYEVEIKKAKNITKKKSTGTEFKNATMTIRLTKKPKAISKPEDQRPKDAWLYLKDFNQSGPYSCLLCSEWFVSKSKIVVHYILNHRKDFCGICRYFLPNREDWKVHIMNHTPWSCSQCLEVYPTELELRQHFKSAHSLVHCRLCYYRLPSADYGAHLSSKHNIVNPPSVDDENLWQLHSDDRQKFICIPCNKPNILSSTFYSHYMGFHHLTLKCLSFMVSGRDVPFSIHGANIRPAFVDTLKNQEICGYVNLDSNSSAFVKPEVDLKESENILNNLLFDVKVETLSENEEIDSTKSKYWDEIKSYKGDVDFDVTLLELVILHKPYFDYVSHIISELNCRTVSEISDIDYEKGKVDITERVTCELCSYMSYTIDDFTSHMYKMHSVRAGPIFSCRICATTFDSLNELESHIMVELGDFDDLWLCQFCDYEFDNRQLTRCHLTEHWDEMEYDNCFSPHLGFKCKYCPNLFWNETDREVHQVKVHSEKSFNHYYKCQCNEVFSDKIWFTYHYFSKHKDDSNPVYLFKCCICSSVLPSINEMRLHFGSNHEEAKKLYCSLDPCKYRPLSHKKSFHTHIKSQHCIDGARKDRVVSCTICSRQFPNARARNVHVSTTHGSGRFKCKLCDEMLHSLDERKLHYLICHPGVHPYVCKECGKSFQYKSSLYIHKQDHSPHKPNYTCEYCKKQFLKRDSFREHMQIHEGPRHACSYCPMRFVQRSNMLRHERRHTGERPYQCHICRKAFADKGACTAHIRTHTRDTSYSCVYCGQTFVQKSKLKYHIRKHTGENLETCQVCSKMFTSACSLREHMKTHEKKKANTVNCPLCDKKFRDERYMIRHIRMSHGGRCFSCPLCQKAFSTTDALKHHVLTHSRINRFHCKICKRSCAVLRTMMKHLRRRHGTIVGKSNVKDWYRKLDPRECQLNLDEDVMTSIFGPPRTRPVNNLLLSNYVTLKNPKQTIKELESVKKNKQTEGRDEEENIGDENSSDEETREETNNDEELSDTKYEGNQELEPTDFVSIKIEPIDEGDYS